MLLTCARLLQLRFVFRRAVEVLSLLITIIFLVQQWMTPLVAVTLELGDDVSLVVLFGRILKVCRLLLPRDAAVLLVPLTRTVHNRCRSPHRPQSIAAIDSASCRAGTT